MEAESESLVTLCALDVVAGRRGLHEFDPAFARATVYGRRPARPGVETVDVAGRGRWTFVFSTPQRLAAHFGDCAFYASTGADLLAQYVDDNGIIRMPLKEGSGRAPGSENPHVEPRNEDGVRIDPQGNPVTGKAWETTHQSPGTTEHMTNYTDFPDLANIYLEDSYVLAIDETPTSLSFRLEAVLTTSHPRYHDPRPDEAHCYADAMLTIADATKIEWITRSSQTYRDATGEEDLGNIDSIQHHDDHYEIAGD